MINESKIKFGIIYNKTPSVFICLFSICHIPYQNGYNSRKYRVTSLGHNIYKTITVE